MLIDNLCPILQSQTTTHILSLVVCLCAFYPIISMILCETHTDTLIHRRIHECENCYTLLIFNLLLFSSFIFGMEFHRYIHSTMAMEWMFDCVSILVCRSLYHLALPHLATVVQPAIRSLYTIHCARSCHVRYVRSVIRVW